MAIQGPEKCHWPDDAQGIETLIKRKEIDFMDFGSSRGASIGWGKKMFGGKRGLGIDISEKKIEEARNAGFDAIRCDIDQLPARELVRYTTMVHFLEHVDGNARALRFLKKACQISREFVFIRQPYFDADGLLFREGLKLFWSDWTAHPNPITTLQFFIMLRTLKNAGIVDTYSIHAKGQILDSDHEAVHPISSRFNSHQYDSGRHPPKSSAIELTYPVFKETVVIAGKGKLDHAGISERYGVDVTIVDEKGKFCGRFS